MYIPLVFLKSIIVDTDQKVVASSGRSGYKFNFCTRQWIRVGEVLLSGAALGVAASLAICMDWDRPGPARGRFGLGPQACSGHPSQGF